MVAPDGKLYVVGIGPGSPEHLTGRAVDAIDDSELIIGYSVYLDLVAPLSEGKEIVSSRMGAEADRARYALEQAAAGKRVALISGGDAGVYGMAGPVFSLLAHESPDEASPIEIEVVPGVTAASACAALLGAPLTQDYAVVSLSDRFVPWEVIDKRLRGALAGDFVIVLYEPSSRHRPDNMRKAWEVISVHRSPATPVAVVRDATRDAQSVKVTRLADLLACEFDMRTTVIVGSTQTVTRGQIMTTGRFYDAHVAGSLDARP